MFWPWILAEFGLIGFFFYIAIWFALFRKLGNVSEFFRIQQQLRLARLGQVLRYFILALAVMGLAGGLNAAFVAFTYFALCGVYLSIYQQDLHENSLRQ